jgi:hypothetical protein
MLAVMPRALLFNIIGRNACRPIIDNGFYCLFNFGKICWLNKESLN